MTMHKEIVTILEQHKIPTMYWFTDTVDNAKRGVEDYFMEEVDPFVYDWEDIMIKIFAELDVLKSGNAPTLGDKKGPNGLEPTIGSTSMCIGCGCFPKATGDFCRYCRHKARYEGLL